MNGYEEKRDELREQMKAIMARLDATEDAQEREDLRASLRAIGLAHRLNWEDAHPEDIQAKPRSWRPPSR